MSHPSAVSFSVSNTDETCVLFCISMCAALCETLMPARITDNLLCSNCLFCFASPFKIPSRSEAQAVIRNFTLSAITSDIEVEQISLPLLSLSFLLCQCNNSSTSSPCLSVGMSRSSSHANHHLNSHTKTH